MKLGDRLPDLLFTSLDGTQVSLSSLRGRPALLFVWASW